MLAGPPRIDFGVKPESSKLSLDSHGRADGAIAWHITGAQQPVYHSASVCINNQDVGINQYVGMNRM